MRLLLTFRKPNFIHKNVVIKNYNFNKYAHMHCLNFLEFLNYVYFFSLYVLHLGTGFNDFGGVRWPLFGLMILLWVMIYFCIWRGMTNSRYVRMFFNCLDGCSSCLVCLLCGHFPLHNLVHSTVLGRYVERRFRRD